jgi:hypothetical protein
MMRTELVYEAEPSFAIPLTTVSSTSAVTGEIIDLRGFHSLDIVPVTGIVGSTSAAFTFSMAHGDDPALSDGTAVGGTDLARASAAVLGHTPDATGAPFGYIGSKRFVRVSVVPSNCTTGSPAVIGAVAVRGCALSQPV